VRGHATPGSSAGLREIETESVLHNRDERDDVRDERDDVRDERDDVVCEAGVGVTTNRFSPAVGSPYS